MIKKFIASAIIGLGIAGLVFVFQQKAPPHSQVQSPRTNTANYNNLVAKPFVEKINSMANLADSASTQKENFTESFINGIGKSIQKSNPDGPQKFNDQNAINLPDPEELSQNLLIEAAQKFDPKSLRPVIKDSDLKISKGNDKEAINAYIKNLQNIVVEAADKIPTTFFLGELSLNDFITTANIYTDTINQVYNLSVPPSLLTIHKKQIELLTAKRNILKSIANYESDPLTTIFAAQELEKIDQEFFAVAAQFNEIIAKN